MAVATGNFAELLWPGIKKIWGNEYERYEKLYPQVFEVMDSDKAFEKFQAITNLPQAGIKPQGKPVPYADPMQGYQKEMVNVTYGLGSTITREMYEDDKYNEINQVPRMLALSANQTQETLAWNIFNRSENAAYTGPDGQTLVSSSHPLVRGGTMSNVLATPGDLTQTNYEVLIMQIMDAVDDDNHKLVLRPKTLVVPTSRTVRAKKILQSDRVTGSADNDKNVVKGETGLLVVPWLTNTDNCFIVTNQKTGLVWLNRRKASIERENEFDTQNLKFMQTWRSIVSWVNFRAVYSFGN